MGASTVLDWDAMYVQSYRLIMTKAHDELNVFGCYHVCQTSRRQSCTLSTLAFILGNTTQSASGEKYLPKLSGGCVQLGSSKKWQEGRTGAVETILAAKPRSATFPPHQHVRPTS